MADNLESTAAHQGFISAVPSASIAITMRPHLDLNQTGIEKAMIKNTQQRPEEVRLEMDRNPLNSSLPKLYLWEITSGDYHG